MVLFILGAVIFLVGTALVAASARYPSRKSAIETCGGGCLIGGVALIALAFPLI
jgi:hypothetical protein